jgi:predicted transcriptional regulator
MLGLEGLGMKRIVACVITILKDQKERSSRDIEVATGLSQPEVSVPLESIINHYEEESKQESAQAMMSIQRLKELTAA